MPALLPLSRASAPPLRHSPDVHACRTGQSPSRRRTRATPPPQCRDAASPPAASASCDAVSLMASASTSSDQCHSPAASASCDATSPPDPVPVIPILPPAVCHPPSPPSSGQRLYLLDSPSPATVASRRLHIKSIRKRMDIPLQHFTRKYSKAKPTLPGFGRTPGSTKPGLAQQASKLCTGAGRWVLMTVVTAMVVSRTGGRERAAAARRGDGHGVGRQRRRTGRRQRHPAWLPSPPRSGRREAGGGRRWFSSLLDPSGRRERAAAAASPTTSVGGGPAAADYSLHTNASAADVADNLWDAFLSSGHAGVPRPFGDTVVDGIELFINLTSPSSPSLSPSQNPNPRSTGGG
uniref:Uncharacterized protein n=1 Tax=Oryza sativa subsp. japonica TaxID=39947 RepID=Q6K6G2_ORYSJ|nr:hypothetical protein [Oryza sativa Japonica Group]